MARPYNRKDRYYHSAKQAGYRSRAAYKLIELDDRFRLIPKGGRIIDLGCWPGGWTQVAVERIGPSGKVIGIDLVESESLPEPNVHFVTGDLESPEAWGAVRELCPGGAQVVLSDMSAKLCGISEIDQAANVTLWHLALQCCGEILLPNGAFVVKVFKNREVEPFIKQVKGRFKSVDRCELDATRNTSKEFYVVGRGYKPE